MTNHAPGGGMTADEFEDVLREYESEATDSVMAYERGSGSHKGHDERASLYRRQLIDAYSAALQRAEAAEGVMGKALQALDDLCVLHHRDVCGDEAFREASKRVTEKGGTLAVWADTAEMLRAALAAAGEGGGTKA
jgi:cysteine synthase